jgi:zinc transport system permease protein
MIASLAIHQLTSTRKINADAAIGLVSSLGISAGIILSSLSGGFNIDLFSYLFGNILTVTSTELYLSSMVLAVTVIFVAFFYNDLFVTTFDQELAQSMGIHTRRINIILFLLTAVAAVLSMKVAGVMLASALLILPALTALQLSASFKKTLAAAVFFASLAVICGSFFAFLLNLPAGPSIVLFNVCFLLITYTAKKISPTRS